MRRLWYFPALAFFYPGYWLCWKAPIGGLRFRIGKALMFWSFIMCSWAFARVDRI